MHWPSHATRGPIHNCGRPEPELLKDIMHALFIYGAPASGKLTAAREVAQQTGFSLFHNHLIVDALLPVLR